LKALKAGKAPARKRVQSGSCGQNNFASEDQRLWTERRKIIAFAFSFFTAGSRSIGPVQFLCLRLVLQRGIAPRAKRLQIEHITQRVIISNEKLLDTEAKTNIIAVSVVDFPR